MFKGIEQTALEQTRYFDTLYIPYSMDEDILLRNIYDILIESDGDNKRLIIAIDSLDEEFLSRLFASIEAIKSLGYKSISFELHVYDNVDSNSLEEIFKKYKIPIKVKYYLSSNEDDFRKRLQNDIKIDNDTDLSSLSKYQYDMSSDIGTERLFRKYHRNTYVGEVVYELIEDVNSTLYECALLQYYAKKYNLAVTLKGSKDLVNMWIEEIRHNSPDIVITNLNNRLTKSKVLDKR